MDTLKVGLAQITSIDDVQANLSSMMSLLQKLGDGKADIVFFPENCLFMRLKEGEAIKGFEISDSVFGTISGWAQENKTSVHLGSVPLKMNDRLFNASVWISADGKVQPSYTKTHLFDIELEGQKPIRESDVFAHGTGPSVLQFGNWNLGQSICYDIRFSDLYHAYAARGVDVITIPSAFLVKTGQAHWDVLMRARAIESQCYVVASAQSGVHESPRGRRETYGHSMVVDPWGHKILELIDSPAIQVVELHKNEIQKVRRQIPMKNHRRGPFNPSNQ